MGGWIALLASILAGVALGYALRRLLARARRHLQDRGWKAYATVVRGLASPLYLGIVAVAVGYGLGFIYLGEALNDLRWTLVRALVLIAVGWTILNLVDLLGDGLRRLTPDGSQELDEMLIPVLVKALRVFLGVLIVTAVLQNLMGVDVTGFLAGLGIAGLALSLAAKESVQNLLGSLTIFLDKPFRVGDVVRFNGSFGIVQTIGLRSTRIRLIDGDMVVQPNMAFVGDKVENLSLRPYIRRELELAIPYETPVEKVEEAVSILESILNEDEVVEQGRFDLDEHPPHVSLCSLEESFLQLRAYYWFRIESERDSGWFEYLDHCHLVNLRILDRFAEAGIELTYPTRRLFLASEEEGLSLSRTGEGSPAPEEGRGRSDERSRGQNGSIPERAPHPVRAGFDPDDAGADDGSDDGAPDSGD